MVADRRTKPRTFIFGGRLSAGFRAAPLQWRKRPRVVLDQSAQFCYFTERAGMAIGAEAPMPVFSCRAR